MFSMFLSSGLPDSDLQALQLLLDHHLWSEAIRLVRQQASLGGGNHRHLYQLLVTRTMQVANILFTAYHREYAAHVLKHSFV